jgi:RecT family
MNALVPQSAPGLALVPQTMDDAIRLAKAMASARLVPKHLHDDVGSCLMVVEQAMRWGMSPFAVAQCTSSIGGRLMYEGKLVSAAVESSGAIEGHFDFDYAGEGDDRQVTVRARRVGEVNDRQLTIKLRDVRTSNEWWKKQPDQQLAYSGVRSWARRYTPAALLGVYAPEEIDRKTGTTIEGEPVIEGAEVDTTQITPPAEKKTEDGGTQGRLSWQQLLEWVDKAVQDATSAEEIDHLLQSQRIKQAERHAVGASKERLDRILADARTRQAELDDKAEEEIPWDGAESTAAPAS